MKRFSDLLFSLIVFVFLIPVMLIVSILLLIFQGRPVVFKQERAGLNGSIFYIHKFRTMNSKVDLNGNLLQDSLRLTAVGRLLRSTSLDELPSLVNVVVGDMSLVGPRPLLKEYLPLYSKEQSRRHDVLPGVTGWAQINGRNTLSWDKKFELDVWYVDNQSWFLDVKILFLTVLKVIKREGIQASSNVTMSRFRGK